MRAHRALLVLPLAGIVLAPAFAPAETACFSFKGEVTEVYRQFPDSFGIPSPVLSGAEIRGKFTFDLGSPGVPGADRATEYPLGLAGIALEVAGVSSSENREPGSVRVFDFLPTSPPGDHLSLSGGTLFAGDVPVWLILNLAADTGDALASDALPRALDLSLFPSTWLSVRAYPPDFRSTYLEARLTSLEPCPQEAPFRRADANADGRVDISDVILVLGALFLGEEAPSCLDAADGNDDGRVNISDPVAMVSSLFLAGGPLPPPNPGCGVDPTLDGLGCSAVPGCP